MRHLYKEHSDRVLLDKVLAREEGAWDELVRRFRGLIYYCIIRVLRRYDGPLQGEEADEIFGEVWIQLLQNDMKKLRIYDPNRGTKLGTWIGIITSQTCINQMRMHSRRPQLVHLETEIEKVDAGPSPLELLVNRERWDWIVQRTSRFSPKERRFFELYYGGRMDTVEVARVMNISIDTVYSRKCKLRVRLQALVNKRTLAA